VRASCPLLEFYKLNAQQLKSSGAKFEFRELHKKDDPILWDGYPARPCIISRLFGLHYKKFWDIFLFGSLLADYPDEKKCAKQRS